MSSSRCAQPSLPFHITSSPYPISSGRSPSSFGAAGRGVNGTRRDGDVRRRYETRVIEASRVKKRERNSPLSPSPLTAVHSCLVSFVPLSTHHSFRRRRGEVTSRDRGGMGEEGEWHA